MVSRARAVSIGARQSARLLIQNAAAIAAKICTQCFVVCFGRDTFFKGEGK